MTIIKLGGSLLEHRDLRVAALKALAARWLAGGSLVVVHGGGRRVDAMMAELGIPKRTHQGLRVTDARTLEVVLSVLTGYVNKSLVAELSTLGVVATGFCGADGATLRAEFHPHLDGVDLGYVGTVVASDDTLIRSLLGSRLLPVIASVALGPDGVLLNLNADAAAAALAVKLRARRLVFLTDVEGLMDGSGQVLSRVGTHDARQLLASSAVGGGMRPKLQACLEALSGGVAEVVIAGPERHGVALRRGIGGTRFVAA
jgi:acetylglutamate kinase